jgi:FMN-dependent oxidoreductase (nitrilotriacetate monooxygenase family)
MTKQIHFNAFEMNCVGHGTHGLWAHPENSRHRYTDLEYWTELAQLLERGLFDAVFIADVIGTYDVYKASRETAVREALQIPNNDPFLVVPAMALVTKHLAFSCTFSTTYEPPFTHARRISTLDHLTKGRVGWNVVTSYLPNAAANFGLDGMIKHDDRYDMADEFLEVCYKLWEGSWEDDAVLRDRERRVYTDPSKVHEIDHVGKYFRVLGPHLSEPSPQRTPVVYQAGTSTRGRQFAARHAEAIFLGGGSVDAVRESIVDIRRQAAELGRDPNHVKMFPSCQIIVGRTRAEADAKRAEIQRFLSVEGMLAHYAGSSGFDLSRYEPDEYLEYKHTDHGQTSARRYTQGPKKRTVREVIEAMGTVGDKSLFFVCGTTEEVADKLQYWIEETGADGFNLSQHLTPRTFTDFIDLVVPELQRRGLYRTSYEDGKTYRERLLGPGYARLPDGHPGAAYRRRAAVAA